MENHILITTKITLKKLVFTIKLIFHRTVNSKLLDFKFNLKSTYVVKYTSWQQEDIFEKLQKHIYIV